MCENSIICKIIDKYKSARHKKSISEYIIYLMADQIPIEAYVELGPHAMEERITKIQDMYPDKLKIYHIFK